LISIFFLIRIASFKKDIVLIEDNLQKTTKELSALSKVRPDTLQIIYLKHKKDYVENWINTNSKLYLDNEDSQITWKYLQNIIAKFAPDFQFNFVVGQRQNALSEYTISGKTDIITLYNFINYIEKQLALYTIESLQLNPSLQETDSGPMNVISFNLVLKPWVDNQTGINILEKPLRRISFKHLLNDPLRARIHRPLRDPMQDELLNYEELILVSYTEDKAFFIKQNKQIITLKYKDKVAYGYFSHIDEEKQEAVFKINKTGLYETVTIPLEKGI
jgi:hypothetical protein